MKRLKPRALAFLGLLMAMPIVASGPALAAPAEIASVIHAATPYGTGKYAVLFITAYDTELWTDAPHWSMDTPFALTLRYHIGFSSSYLVNRSLREMKGVDPKLSDADIERYRKAMAFFAPASSGDEMTMLYQPGQPVRFFKNGAPTGEVNEPGFAQDFFGVWLSPATSEPDLRKSLLNLK
jgi:Chalcone isomerase-like